MELLYPRGAILAAFVVNWIAIIAAALGILRSLIEALSNRRKIDSAVAQALLKSNHEAMDAIEKAQQAREQVRAAHARGTDPMSDDEFKRPD